MSEKEVQQQSQPCQHGNLNPARKQDETLVYQPFVDQGSYCPGGANEL